MAKRRTSGEISLTVTLSVSAHSDGVEAFCTSTARSSAACAAVAISSTNAQLAARIHIPGIRLHRQRIEPATDRLCTLPVIVRELLALAQGGIVAGVAERSATLE